MDEASVKRRGLFSAIEQMFEHFIWYFRLVIVLGVVGLLMGSSIVFVFGIIETTHLVVSFAKTMWATGGHLPHEPEVGALSYNGLILGLITVVDDFLIGIVLLIFGLGSYDLFISRIDAALDQNDIRPDWLVFESLDELKSVLGKVVLMILTINFLRITIDTEFENPLHLVYLGLGIALVSIGLKLTHGKDINVTKAQLRVHGHEAPGRPPLATESGKTGPSNGRRHRRRRAPAEARCSALSLPAERSGAREGFPFRPRLFHNARA
jgi:uncharacterized membrane protein YqhA